MVIDPKTDSPEDQFSADEDDADVVMFYNSLFLADQW